MWLPDTQHSETLLRVACGGNPARSVLKVTVDAFRWSSPIPQLPHENRECLITRDSEVSQLGGPLKCLMARTIAAEESVTVA